MHSYSDIHLVPKPQANKTVKTIDHHPKTIQSSGEEKGIENMDVVRTPQKRNLKCRTASCDRALSHQR
jgi:hypothetical protein